MDQDKNAQYLYKISHYALSDTCLNDEKVINSFQTVRFQEYLEKNNISSTERQEVEFCPKCLTVLIPGVNLSMRCIFGKKQKQSTEKQSKSTLGKKRRERKLRFTCHSCNKHTDYDIFNTEEEINPNKSKASIAIDNSNKPSLPAAKNRAKNRKKNNLSNLIKNKKQQEEDTKRKTGLLSLDEFMKN